MMERIVTFLRQPWLITLRRLVLMQLVFVALWYLAAYARSWEGDFYGCTRLHVPIAVVAIAGCIVVPLVGCVLYALYWWRKRRVSPLPAEAAEPAADEKPAPPAPGVLRRWWDAWVLLVVLAVSVPLCYWYHYKAENRSHLTISCQGGHGEGASAYADWVSPEATAQGVCERLPAERPYLHSFLLPDGDFCVGCKNSSTSFALSHIRSTRRFTLKPHFDIKGAIDLYICQIKTDEDRRRTHTLLNYYMENPNARRPRIRRMPFTLCENAAVLYLDYGEYVLLPVHKGGDPTEAPALIYISLQP
ncbi:MAG: hypothetical protein Q4F38_02670 [Akkermansia sp.]|nr:hypothetical protein [Akkermansia sp.]